MTCHDVVNLIQRGIRKEHGNCHFYTPAPAGLLEGRGLATPKFYTASRVYMQKKKGYSLEEM